MISAFKPAGIKPKPDFDKCEEEATRLLFKLNVTSPNIDILSLHYDRNIIFDSIQNYCNIVHKDIFSFNVGGILKDGCTIVLENSIFLVLYNDDVILPERLNWTLAHEIGHIYLGHVKNEEKEEIEAHWFAAQFLMPEYIIRYMKKQLGSICKYDLISCFGVSEAAAKYRLKSLSRRREHEYLTQNEYIVLKRYLPHIDCFCENQKRIYAKLS